MTLDQLRVFIAVAERSHVTRAAQALAMTQSAPSAAIASLERQSGVRLFNRVGRGIELTEAGFMPAMRSARTDVRSNMVNGMPRPANDRSSDRRSA